MKRREFIAGALLGAMVRHAQAQQSGKVYHIVIVHPSTPKHEMKEEYRTLFERLRQLGYVEGKNLVVEIYSGEGRTEYYAELASYAVRSNPDLIFTVTAYMLRHFKAATVTTPIIGITADPVAFGIVPSLARPGSNITGVVVDAGIELWGKRLALLKEAVPKLSTVSFVASRAAWEAPPGAAMRKAAEAMGISLVGSVL